MRFLSYLKCSILALLVVFFASSAFAVTFTTELVESGDSVGYAKDAVCGPNGEIYLSYMNDAGDDISNSDDVMKCATYDGSVWTVQTVIAPEDQLASNTSIALDSSGHPHILYNYSCQAVTHLQDMDHAWWDGNEWQTENVFDGEFAVDKPGHPSLAISDTDMMNVIFHVKEDMYWATKQFPSGLWTVSEIEGVAGSHTSMVLDGSGYPHVSYKHGCGVGGDLGYSHYDGSEWVHEDVVSADAYGTSIAFDPDGEPCISFVDGKDTPVLYYAHKDGAEWEVESVDQDGKIMWRFTSLGFTSDGTPFIAYLDEVDDNDESAILKVAGKTSSGGWVTVEVAEAGNEEGCQLNNVCLAIDGQDYVHAFYNGYNESEDVNVDVNHVVTTESLVSAKTDGSGGGCSVGSFVPFALLLLAPLSLLRK